MQNSRNEDWSELLPNDPQAGDALWDLASGFGESPEIDVEEAWKTFEQKLESKPASPKSSRVRRFGWKRVVTAAAAAIALFFVVNFFSSDSSVTQYANFDSGEKSMILEDQSEVTLMEGAELLYRDEGDARMVELQGDAIFEVTSDASRPFHVITSELEVIVVGTEFKVTSGSEASVKVMEGHVRVRGHNEVDWMDLYAGDTASVNDELVATKKSSSLAGVPLRFDEVALRIVVENIENAHDIELLFPAKLSSCSITADFSGSSVMEIASSLAVLFNADMSVDGQTVELKGGSCQ